MTWFDTSDHTRCARVAAWRPVRVVLASLAMALCDPTLAAGDTSPPGSLYARLGGEAIVAKVVDETIDRCATSPQTRRSFDKVNLRNLKKKLVEQICFLGGGGCEYAGDDMKLVHKGLDITESEFYGLVDILRDSLNKAGVAEGPKNELLRLLAPMKRDIVTK